ncbi:esterase family protein [Sinomicrobium kalidii]|uniref:alpha/beta hydrolase n=1 Tax=Sinomicrobium kalidii TaxID=2900738 RepID=UPI001E51F582|nr:alpha/beta hydrolase-fold protein [Sinomicrobium kalidii]UGU17329.1 esterase family protein [Sinomicrobium kalidii]
MKYIFCLCVSFFFAVNTMYAQYKKTTYTSEKLGEDREIIFHIPENYDAKKKYPLIVVLDADYLFETVMAASGFYTYNDEMPESIIVGIRQENSRLSDCNYNEDTGFPKDKGNNFFEFIGMELLPSLADEYNLADFRIIIGHGLTANFINYYLFKDRPLFDAYVNIAPTFAPNVTDYLTSRLSTLTIQKFYYLITSDKNRDAENAARIEELHQSLQAIDNDQLHYNFSIVEDSDNYTVAAHAIPRSLYGIFDLYQPIPPEEYEKEVLSYEEGIVYDYLENKYNAIHGTYDVDKKIRLNDVMAIYAACLEKEDLPSLESLGKLGKKEFPDTMLGYFFEAEFHEKSGNTKKAMRTYEKAFLMSEIDFLTKDMVQERIFNIKKDMGW